MHVFLACVCSGQLKHVLVWAKCACIFKQRAQEHVVSEEKFIYVCVCVWESMCMCLCLFWDGSNVKAQSSGSRQIAVKSIKREY